MTKLAFVDTETTSTRYDRRGWEIGIIIREPEQEDVERHWFIDWKDLDMANADVKSLLIGGFYDRHPQAHDRLADEGVWPEGPALRVVEYLTRGAHIVGAVPGFDAEVLSARMRAHGIQPSWHYHLIDVEVLAIGWVSYRGKLLREQNPDVAMGPWPPLPWESDDLSRAIGIDPPAGEDRHTAIGDARWARAIYDAVTTGKAKP